VAAAATDAGGAGEREAEGWEASDAAAAPSDAGIIIHPTDGPGAEDKLDNFKVHRSYYEWWCGMVVVMVWCVWCVGAR
jgi:hypothetical protein